MIYTEEENLRWWNGLAKTRQGEIIESVIANANSRWVSQWAESVMEIWGRDGSLTLKDLASLRKWDR